MNIKKEKTMNKNEFLAFSLPYGLKVYVKYNHKPEHSELEKMIGIVDDRIITDIHEEDIAPLFISEYGLCLRPLSDLTKEIEHKGEKFVPLKMINYFSQDGNRSFEYILSKKDIKIEDLPFWVINLLLEWKFDLADLISKGEAIDVNILDINPYK